MLYTGISGLATSLDVRGTNSLESLLLSLQIYHLVLYVRIVPTAGTRIIQDMRRPWSVSALYSPPSRSLYSSFIPNVRAPTLVDLSTRSMLPVHNDVSRSTYDSLQVTIHPLHLLRRLGWQGMGDASQCFPGPTLWLSPYASGFNPIDIAALQVVYIAFYAENGMCHADLGFYCRLWTAISSLDPCTTSTHCRYIYIKDASTHLDQML